MQRVRFFFIDSAGIPCAHELNRSNQPGQSATNNRNLFHRSTKRAEVSLCKTIAWPRRHEPRKPFTSKPGIYNSTTMETKVDIRQSTEPLNILLVGNNPIDLTRTLEKINQLDGRRIVTEIAFDLRSLVERLMRFRPNFILIDDNIGKEELTQAIQTLTASRKTKDVPITVLKNSNYQEASSNGILDYVLKHNFSAESFYTMLRNSLKFRRTQLYLYKA